MIAGQRVWTAVIAAVLALMVLSWIYGIYCYIQMVRHRRPGIPASSLLWPPGFLTEQGRQFRRRALWSYALFAVLAAFLIALNFLLRP
jgi:hypothetical protein